jgi:molybdopterin-guanine dinucleotide biosynthesis protein A
VRHTGAVDTTRDRLAAVVLAGGTGVRLGGVDKASIEVAGRTLLEHALAAVAAAGEVVVVGPQVWTSRAVTWAREDPPHGGPAAALLTGLDTLLVRPELVCVLAVDMPRFSAGTLTRLIDVLHAGPDADAACLIDERRRVQWLAAVYRYDALLAARPTDRADQHGLSIRELVGPLRVAEVPALAEEARDVDTWEDLRRLRE